MRRLRLVALSCIAAFMVAIPAHASAAVTFTQVKLTATVSGTSVTASTTIRASASTVVQQLGICVRDSGNHIVDFPARRARAVIPTSGVDYTAVKTFASGTFTYYPCFQLNGKWVGVGKKKFTVGNPGATPSPSTSPTSASQPSPEVPTVWQRVYTQDFSTDTALGQIEKAYGTAVKGYDDATPTTWRNGGCWYPSKTLSVHDGLLDTYLHSESGLANGCRFLSSASVPYGWHGQVYGQFTVRMRADPVAGYKTAFLLWPESNNWGDGEIDFPEADLTEPVTGAVHRLSPADPNLFTKVTAATTQTGWHDYTIQWLPGHVRMLIDGVLQQDFVADVPKTPHVWVLQSETAYGAPTPAASGHVLVDSVSVDAYVG